MNMICIGRYVVPRTTVNWRPSVMAEQHGPRNAGYLAITEKLIFKNESAVIQMEVIIPYLAEVLLLGT